MRKLVLSLCVVAATAAYVARNAMVKEGGVENLLDRVTFRSAPPPSLLDPLDGSGALSGDDLFSVAPSPQSDLTPVPPAGPTALALADPTPTASVPLPLPDPEAGPLPAPSPGARPDPRGGGIVPPLPRLRGGPSAPSSLAAARPPAVALAQPAPVPAAPPPAPSTPAVPTVTGKFRDGTYTGSRADAYYGLVQVRANVQGGKIVSVDVLTYPADRSRSRSINGYALPILEREAVSAQDASVNVISGATLTTVAYTRSLGSALAQAG